MSSFRTPFVRSTVSKRRAVGSGMSALRTKSVLEKTGRLNNQSSAGVAYRDRVILGMLVFKSS